MKTLCLIRHAKTEPSSGTMADIDRTLMERGLRDSAIMAKWLCGQKISFDHILVSTAQRARQTAQIFADHLAIDESKLTIADVIYNANLDELLELVQTLPDDYQHVLLCGHNPGITNLANALSKNYTEDIPTCGLYAITFKTDDWTEVSRGNSCTLFYEYPKQHR